MLFHHYDRKQKKWVRNERDSGNWESDECLEKKHWCKKSRAYYIDDWPEGWRQVGNSHEILSLRYTGWHTNYYGDTGVLRGFVLQLPARKGKTIYVPGTYHTEDFGVTIYPFDWSDDKEDAARSADSYAEVVAEAEREYSVEWYAERDIENLHEEIATDRKKMLALILEIKAAKRNFTPAICAALTTRLRDLWDARQKAFARIAALEENYWLAVEE